MEIVGKVIQILPLQQGTSQRTGNSWAVQSFIIETQEQFPRKVCIELFGEERIKQNPFSMDEIVTVNFDLESREFNGRWYTSARAWRVQPGTADVQIPNQQQVAAQSQTVQQQTIGNTQSFDALTANAAPDNGSDLPF